MQKSIKKIAVYVSIYLIVFFIGLRSGEIYYRNIANRTPQPIENSSYYLIENYNYGTYKQSVISEIDDSNIIIKLLRDEKLKPLLKKRDIEIYDKNGERLY